MFTEITANLSINSYYSLPEIEEMNPDEKNWISTLIEEFKQSTQSLISPKVFFRQAAQPQSFSPPLLLRIIRNLCVKT